MIDTKRWPVKLSTAITICAAIGASALHAAAQAIAPAFASDYTLSNLGSAPGVPVSYGGLTINPASPDTLLLGGAANGGSGAIYSIGVTRGAGNHITGFTGSASLFSTAPDIDGGLAYGPGGDLFYTAYPSNEIGEIKPGSSSPDKIVPLGGLGITSSVGTLGFVPNGFGADGVFKVISYTGGGEYDVSLTADGSGTYDLGSATLESTPGGGPEGIAYVPAGNPDFGTNSALLSQYSADSVRAYQVDGSGNLETGTQQNFIVGLNGAEGAFVDPLTGDFLFSTFGGGNQVLVVQGFTASAETPEPGSIAMLTCLLATGSGVLVRRRRSRKRA